MRSLGLDNCIRTCIRHFITRSSLTSPETPGLHLSSSPSQTPHPRNHRPFCWPHSSAPTFPERPSVGSTALPSQKGFSHFPLVTRLYGSLCLSVAWWFTFYFSLPEGQTVFLIFKLSSVVFAHQAPQIAATSGVLSSPLSAKAEVVILVPEGVRGSAVSVPGLFR